MGRVILERHEVRKACDEFIIVILLLNSWRTNNGLGYGLEEEDSAGPAKRCSHGCQTKQYRFMINFSGAGKFKFVLPGYFAEGLEI